LSFRAKGNFTAPQLKGIGEKKCIRTRHFEKLGKSLEPSISRSSHISMTCGNFHFSEPLPISDMTELSIEPMEGAFVNFLVALNVCSEVMTSCFSAGSG
jgi:hypothetical protein